MNRTVGIALIVACAALSLAVVGLSVALYQKPRFTETKGDNPYVMFDNKTAQTCWSGPAKFAWSDYPESGQQPAPPTLPADFFKNKTKATNQANLPFCKELK